MPALALAAQQAAQLRYSGSRGLTKQRCTAVPAARRRITVAAAAQAQPKSALAFHIADTTVSFPLCAEEGRKLSEALAGVMQTFAEKQKAERPKRYASMEYVFKGDTTQREIEQLEVVCNPNAYATPFDAKAFITLRTADGLRLSTEGKLVGIKADVEEFLAQL